MKKPTQRKRNTDRNGSVLLAVLILGAALAATSTVLAVAARRAAGQQSLRADALCARYAASSGLLHGPAAVDLASWVGGRTSHLEVFTEKKRSDWCLLTSRAQCGGAVRTAERTVGVELCH